MSNSIILFVVKKMNSINQLVLPVFTRWRNYLRSHAGNFGEIASKTPRAEKMGQVLKQFFLSIPCEFFFVSSIAAFTVWYQLNRFILKWIYILTGQKLLLKFFPLGRFMFVFSAGYAAVSAVGFVMCFVHYFMDFRMYAIAFLGVGVGSHILVVLDLAASLINQFEQSFKDSPSTLKFPLLRKISNFFSIQSTKMSYFLNTSIPEDPVSLSDIELGMLFLIDECFKNNSLDIKQLTRPLDENHGVVKIFFTNKGNLIGINLQNGIKEVATYDQSRQEVHILPGFSKHFYKALRIQVEPYFNDADLTSSTHDHIELNNSNAQLKMKKS